MKPSIEIYTVTHSSPEIKTVGDYCGDISSPAHQYVNKEEDFLNVKDPISKQTNRDSIYSSYITPKELKDNKTKPAREILLKTGTQLYIPVNKIDTVGLLTQGIQVVSNDDIAFKSQMLAELESDEKYQQVLKPIKGKIEIGTLTNSYPMATVWLWCRSLSKTTNVSGGSADMDGEIFDITPFVEKLSTSVGKNGGNFQLSLPPLTCELESTRDSNGNVNNRWVIKKSTIKTYTADGQLSYISDDNIYSGVTTRNNEEYLKRNSFLFHTIINANDLIFVRFETLTLDQKQRYQDSSNFYVNKDSLAGRIYDMIGLVDTNNLDVDPSGNNVSINITGRDLMKLFIDDGTYFYNLENITGQFRVAGESTRDNELMRRIVGDNSLYYLNLYQNTSIEHILQFVIQQLSSIGIVPDSLLTSYGNRRNKRFRQRNKDLDNKQRLSQLESKRKSARQLIYSEQQKTGNKLIDQGQSAYNKFHLFLKSTRDNKVRLTNGKQTIGWSSFTFVNEFLMNNKLPLFINTEGLVGSQFIFNRSSLTQQNIVQIFDVVDEIIDLEESQPKGQDENRFSEELARGIWQIVKLVIDKSVVDRRLVDSSMSSANGSLLNFFRKACQEPFVELYTDTYKDMFHVIVRKPPFDKKGVQSMLQGEVNTENGPITIKPVVVDVELESVLKEELSFDATEAYSWYSFRPQNVYAGGGSTLPAAYTPAIFFPEYAAIWGSVPFEKTHNYNPYYPVVNNDGVVDVSRFEMQAIYDLKYIIESHQYLPFTRKGTITLSGDRRIKRGNFIRYRPTNEIFYVEAVAQHFSVSDKNIDRTTVVQVSRGMVEQFIYGITIPSSDPTKGYIKISYFDIINTDIKVDTKKYPPKKQKNQRRVTVVKDPTASVLEYEDKIVEEEIEVPGYFGIDIEKALSNLKVNTEVFNYFLRKEQFEFKEYIRVDNQVKQQGSRR